MGLRRVSKIVVFDMDGVIFREKNFWLRVHLALGTKDKGIYFTNQYLKSDYTKLVREVLKLWKGRPAAPYLSLVKRLRYTPGVKATFRKLKKEGYYIVVISSGSRLLLQRASRELPIDKGYANELVIKKGKIAGIYKQTVQYDNKVPILKQVCEELNVPMKKVIAVGDSENDIPLFKKVGLSIAFRPISQKVKCAAIVTTNSLNLTDILKFL